MTTHTHVRCDGCDRPCDASIRLAADTFHYSQDELDFCGWSCLLDYVLEKRQSEVVDERARRELRAIKELES